MKLQSKSDLGLLLPGGKTGVLLLHDVSGSAAELRGHANALARCGYTVSCPQLVALGLDGGAGQGSAGNLVSEAEQALSRLRQRCDNVAVVGMAYGSMLALELARHNAIAVQAVVLVDPRAWLPSLPFKLAAGLSGRIKQSWIADLAALFSRVGFSAGDKPGMSGLMGLAANGGAGSPAALRALASLLDSVHAGLPAIRQPALLIHQRSNARGGRDGSFLLQRRLGGRVESIMIDDQPHAPPAGDRGADFLAERSSRFVSTVLEEIATRRENELRRQKIAAGNRTDAA